MDDLIVEVEADTGPSTALKWTECQPECDHIQLLTVKRIRDLAGQKTDAENLLWPKCSANNDLHLQYYFHLHY